MTPTRRTSGRVVVAPDSFGGHLTARAAAERIRAALADRGFDAVAHPMADGGEGTLEALDAHRLVELGEVEATGPLGAPVLARIGRIERGDESSDAFVETAEACGLARVTARTPLLATTFGVGELLVTAAEAVDGGVFVGLGGSATVDGGLGALQALGLVALDGSGRRIEGGTASDLLRVASLDGDPPLEETDVTLLADVRTSLQGSVARYGPQKGLRPEHVPAIQDALLRWADALGRWGQGHGYPALDLDLLGGGAAGGLSFALASVLDATLLSGAEWMARTTHLSSMLQGSTAVIVGEGRLDATSFEGKVMESVIRRAREHGTPVWALVGSTEGSIPAPPQGPDHVLVIGGTDDASWTRALEALANGLSGP